MLPAVLAAALAVGSLTACTAQPPGDDTAASPSPSIRTLSPLPAVDSAPPAGRLVADLRQSSRDAALGRFQVWVGNGLDRELVPRRLTYRDPRLRRPVPGERLRPVPAGSERGYPLAQPSRPRCGADPRQRGALAVAHGGRTVTVRVQDEADVVRRYVAERCAELEVARVVTLAFDDVVAADRRGEGAVGTLVLVVTPTGVPGRTLRIDAVTGTPVLTAADPDAWRPRVTVRGDGEPVRVDLPVRPARCDAHAFAESGGATAFRLRLRLDGEPRELVLRMSAQGASAAIALARESCGLG